MNDYIVKGEKYLSDCVFDGLAHSFDVLSKTYVKPYPEVTGYVIKYFCENYNELPKNIVKAGNKLIKLQDKKTGGYASFCDLDTLFAFDTSQILIGLLALFHKSGKRKYYDSAIKAGDFLLMLQQDNGGVIPIYNRKTKEKIVKQETYAIWNGPWSGLMCKLTEGFQALYDATLDDKYIDAKNKVADFYIDAEYIECSHPLGYWLEGLYEAGKMEKVKEILETKVIPRITSNGYISYKDNLEYSYVSGTIQLGIILAKMGYKEEAQKIRSYGRLVQSKHESGGLFQYAGPEGDLDYHVHTEINSWGTKYFCQLEKILEE